MAETEPKYNLFLVLSPLRILICLIIVMLFEVAFMFGKNGGWEMLAFIYGIPAIIILLLLDYVIKSLAKKEILVIWVIQLLIVAISAAIFYL